MFDDKRNILITFLMIIVFILLLNIGFLTVRLKTKELQEYSSDKKDVKEQVKVIDYSDLINKVNLPSSNKYSYYFMLKEKTIINDLSDRIKLELVLNNLEKTSTISTDLVNNKLKELFGNEYDYNVNNLVNNKIEQSYNDGIEYPNTSDCYVYYYSPYKGEYVANTDCSVDDSIKDYRKIVSTTTKDDSIEINQVIGFIKDNKIYKDNKYTELVSSNINENGLYDKLDEYKFIFKLNNSDYYFYSVEKVK